MDKYTKEILTRKDFRLLNHVYNNDEIPEEELDKMEVVGDGLEHLNNPKENTSNPNLSDLSLEEFESRSFRHSKSDINQELSLQNLQALNTNKHKIA